MGVGRGGFPRRAGKRLCCMPLTQPPPPLCVCSGGDELPTACPAASADTDSGCEPSGAGASSTARGVPGQDFEQLLVS